MQVSKNIYTHVHNNPSVLSQRWTRFLIFFFCFFLHFHLPVQAALSPPRYKVQPQAANWRQTDSGDNQASDARPSLQGSHALTSHHTFTLRGAPVCNKFSASSRDLVLGSICKLRTIQARSPPPTHEGKEPMNPGKTDSQWHRVPVTRTSGGGLWADGRLPGPQKQ